MASSDILSTLETRWTFHRRPVPIPADLRPAWRIALILLALHKCCYGAKSSLQRLHVLNWAARTSRGRQTLLAAIDNQIPPEAVIIRFEPSLNRALDFARAQLLIYAPTGDRIQLTPQGREAAAAIE